jgi:hypothetical protein
MDTEQLPRLGHIRRDPPCLIARQASSSVTDLV